MLNQSPLVSNGYYPLDTPQVWPECIRWSAPCTLQSKIADPWLRKLEDQIRITESRLATSTIVQISRRSISCVHWAVEFIDKIVSLETIIED